MIEWYIPITIIPGIGMLTISTSNLLTDLNQEIRTLAKNPDERALPILRRKMKQLKLLSLSQMFLYVAVFCFLISGLKGAVFEDEGFVHFSIIIGVILSTGTLLLLILYAYRAIGIRQDLCELEEKESHPNL